MLSRLDHILFPDRCEVYEVIPSQRYVYAIYKNGSSSLMTCGLDKNWRVFLNNQISKLNSIDIVLRDPNSRMISGINTYLQQVLQKNPDLDRQTVIWFIKNYLFLNRHYCPQFFWLVNLARYLNSTAKLNFLTMQDLSNIVDRDFKPAGFNEVPDGFADEIGDIPDLEMYQRLDKAIIDSCTGKSLTFSQMINSVQESDHVAYKYVIGQAVKIFQPLYELPKT